MLRRTILLSLCALPVWAAGGAVPIGTCTSPSMQVSVYPGNDDFAVILRLAGEEAAMPAVAQKMFGDLGATSNSTEAQLILTVILRENETEQLAMQRYGSERLVEDATCDDGAALRAVIAGALN